MTANDRGPALATPAPEATHISSGASVLLHGEHVEAHAAHRKRYANIRARLALRGFSLVETEAGIFIVSRWNLTRECISLGEVEQFAQQAGCQS